MPITMLTFAEVVPELRYVTNTEERVEELVNELDEALAPRYCSGVKERNSGEGSSLPVHKYLEGSSGGC